MEDWRKYRAPTATKTNARPAATQISGEAPVGGIPADGLGATVAVATTTPPIKGVIVAKGVAVAAGAVVAVGAAVVGATATKFAITLLFVLIVTVVGFALPLASPLQLLNVYPLLAFAVKLTVVPAVYRPPLQLEGVLTVTPPVPRGLTAVDNV